MSEQDYERSFTVEQVDAGTRTFTGKAIPYDTPTRINDWDGRYTEVIARGAVQAAGRVPLFWDHAYPIGVITGHEQRDDGWWVTGRFSETGKGDEAYTLLRDGAVSQLSLRFLSDKQHDVTGTAGRTITRTRIYAREVSVVPFGAYGENATVTEVRNTTTNALGRSNPMPTMDDTVADELRTAQDAQRADIDAQRNEFDEFVRRMDAYLSRHDDDEQTPTSDDRSAGEFLRALAGGDQDTVRAYNELMEHMYDETFARAYTGGTTADGVLLPGWVGDLTRLFDSSSGVLAAVFSTGTLPASGMTIDFSELNTNTTQVTEQVNQGDDLAFGKVTMKTRNAPVKTYGGYTQLSRQEIERQSIPILNRHLDALGLAAGARKKAVLRGVYDALVTANTAIAADAGVVKLGATLANATADQWENTLIDAAIKYDGIDLAPDALIVSGTVFKYLRSLTVAGERVFQVWDKNASGSLNLPGLNGNISGIPVFLDPGQTGDAANFVNSRAIRQYDSALTSLQDENIVNLSKTFSVYKYGAVAAEIPSALIPVKLSA